MKKQDDTVASFREACRKLVRELGMLQLNNSKPGRTPQHWHALIEIDRDPGITISKLSDLLLLSLPATSRVIDSLITRGLVAHQEGTDKRQKKLFNTEKGKAEIANIDDFNHVRIKGALKLLTDDEQRQIIASLKRYGEALECSRRNRDEIKILKLPKSQLVRKEIVALIESIQNGEFKIPINADTNRCVLRAEENYCFNNECNFWFAVNQDGKVIGSIALRKLGPGIGEIKKFFVHKDYRGSGISNNLFERLLRTASQHRFKQLYLGTVEQFKAAHRFYEKRGFQKTTRKQLPASFIVAPTDQVFYRAGLRDLTDR